MAFNTEKFNVGDKIRAIASGWTGTIVSKSPIRDNGYKVRWENGTESWVRPVSMEKIS